MSDEPKTEISKKDCARCGKSIDGMATRCPFCGADSRTGARNDDDEIVREVLSSRPPPSRTDRLISTLRERQGLALLGLTLVVGGALWLVTATLTGGSSADAVATDAVPLPEVFAPRPAVQTDEPLPMPELRYHFDGNPSRFEKWIEEEGEVAPPPEEPRSERPATRATTPSRSTPQPTPQPAAPTQRPPVSPPAAPREPVSGTSSEDNDQQPETGTASDPAPPTPPLLTRAGSPSSG